MSPEQARELQEFVLSRLTMFPRAEVSVTARPGGAVVKEKLETDEDEFEVKDADLERFRLQVVIL